MIFLIILVALALDYLFGEPKKFHPLVGFGKWAEHVERFTNKYEREALLGRICGAAAFIIAVIPIVIALYFFQSFLSTTWGWVFDALILALAIGHKSLREHALKVVEPLMRGDLDQARRAVAMIVSRDTTYLNQNEISKATIESVLENGSDAIFAAIFWYVLAGLPGVVLYRLTNTLDAMWGYRTQRFNYFGWFAARFDDVLNFIPARLTALAYSLSGDYSSARHCWKTQGKQWYSINAGRVMAAGAGALQIKLGGDSNYHGQIKSRPVLGLGDEARVDDINRSLKLIVKSILIWLIVILVVQILREIL